MTKLHLSAPALSLLLLSNMTQVEAQAKTGADTANATMHTNHPNHSNHSNHQGYHHSFSDAKKWVEKFDAPARNDWQKPDQVIQALNLKDTDRIADIGAGTGYFSLRIARAHPSVTVYATDVEPDMIKYLEEQTQKEGLHNHIPILIKPNNIHLPEKVNIVIVVDTYHHIDDRVSYFAKLKKQLLPDNKIAIIDFSAESPEGPPPEHRISKEALIEEMKNAGYSVEKELTFLPNQYFVIFK